MTERDIVRRLQQRSRWIGDDCAILPNGKTELLVTTDQFLEDVHFRRKTHTGADVGWAALARGLSDIAAMGGKARYGFVSLALPEWACGHWLNDFYKGFFLLADRHKVDLGGGDLSHADKFYCDVTVLGETPRGKALRRSGAKPGDWIYVSGPLGKPKKRPEPRLDIAPKVRAVASACMDVSDGLSIDLSRLCESSGVGAELTEVPVSRGATLEDALHRGEDYELLFTSSKRLRYPRIGTIARGRGITFQGRTLKIHGYDHFSRSRT